MKRWIIINNLDQYYTNPKIAQELFSKIKAKIDLNSFVLFEPSAGNGAFSDLFLTKFVAIDIDPRRPYIQKFDFFEYDFTHLNKSKIVTIGNPPFGKNFSCKVFL